MKLSIIVPAYNSENTIGQCLQAIFNSDFKDFEIIVVDDASTDRTIEIAQGFSCRIIRLPENRGPSYARAVVIKEAASDIVVFIDSDIIIKNNTLAEVCCSFGAEPDILAVVGLLSKEHPNKNFFSVYKNLYMNYIFNACPDYINFLYGSFYSIKKTLVDFQLTSNRLVEDTELGIRLYNKGYRILLNKKLEVVHLKRYSLCSFIKNDFLVPYYWARLFTRHVGLKTLMREKRFCHARMPQLLSLFLAPICLLSILIQPIAALILICIFILLNSRFFAFYFREKGFLFMLKAIIITWLDMLIMDAGIVAGFISMFFALKAKTY